MEKVLSKGNVFWGYERVAVDEFIEIDKRLEDDFVIAKIYIFFNESINQVDVDYDLTVAITKDEAKKLYSIDFLPSDIARSLFRNIFEGRLYVEGQLVSS